MWTNKKDLTSPQKLRNGIFLYNMNETNKHSLILVLSRGLLVFLLVFGSVGGFLSAFDIPYNTVAFASVVFLSAMFFSVIYMKTAVRNLGYFIFFILFVVWSLRYRNYINSGFYALINEMTLTIADYFQQSGVQEYSEFMSNRYVTVTMMACFIGIVDTLLINISVIRKIKLFQMVSISMLVYFIPVYLEQEPDLFYVLCMVAGLGGAITIKAGNLLKLFPKRKNLFRKKKDVMVHVSYQQSPKLWMQTIAVMLSIAILSISLLLLLIPKRTFQQRFSDSLVKTTMDAYVLDIWQFGLDGIFNKNASGGMGKGQIGRAASVRPDYETDLVIRFTPYSTKPLYLKAYTGIVYGENQWESEAELLQFTSNETPAEVKFKSESLQEEALILSELSKDENNNLAVGKLWIENVDADTEFLYYPYYTLLDDYTRYAKWKQGIRVGKSMEYTYYPLVSQPMLSEKREQPDDIYLDVPEKNKKAIAEFCKEINLHGNQGEIIEQVVTYFEENIPYTVRPGAVPKDEDVINYFLTKNKKGYCAHFASSAVLIFRYMGIPARYVEGYALGYGQILEGSVLEDAYEDYYQGYSALGKTAVMEVEVSDASAHAWVEVFDKEFGWIPVEVTPSSSEELQDENGFWDFLRNLFDESEAVELQEGLNNTQEIVLVDIEVKRIGIFLLILAAILVLVILWRVAQRMWHHRSLESRSLVISEYARLCEMLRCVDVRFHECSSHREQIMWMLERFQFDESEMLELSSAMEKISYSMEEMDEALLIAIREQLLNIRTEIRKQLTLRERGRVFWKNK